MTWNRDYACGSASDIPGATRDETGKGRHGIYASGTWRAKANKENDDLMDRAAQKAGQTYSGVAGFAMQDASVQETWGRLSIAQGKSCLD